MLHGYLFVIILSSKNMFHFQHPQPQPQPHPDLPPHRAVDQVRMSPEFFLRGSYLVYVNPQALLSYAVEKHERLKRQFADFIAVSVSGLVLVLKRSCCFGVLAMMLMLKCCCCLNTLDLMLMLKCCCCLIVSDLMLTHKYHCCFHVLYVMLMLKHCCYFSASYMMLMFKCCCCFSVPWDRHRPGVHAGWHSQWPDLWVDEELCAELRQPDRCGWGRVPRGCHDLHLQAQRPVPPQQIQLPGRGRCACLRKWSQFSVRWACDRNLKKVTLFKENTHRDLKNTSAYTSIYVNILLKKTCRPPTDWLAGWLTGWLGGWLVSLLMVSPLPGDPVDGQVLV